MKLLNLGCGDSFHKDWINVDFVSTHSDVTSHNLLEGIPFNDNVMDVVYHSHVLEHFSKKDGFQFIKECARVLKSNGILRIAVPDLEKISIEYLRTMQLAMSGDETAKKNYEWIVLELFDQMVRNESGGLMTSYLHQQEIPNESYVIDRLGSEAKKIRAAYEVSQEKTINQQTETIKKRKTLSDLLLKIKRRIKKHIRKTLSEHQLKALKIGQFRLAGEIHQWMYDRYSLSELLKNNGFKDIKVCTAFESSITNWESYQLDVIGEEVRKPDSLFIEARKL